jgi:PPM family protein phosphatase
MAFWRRRSRSRARELRRLVESSGWCGDTFIESGFATALGRRPDNQDRCAIATRWVVLSDGAGGHKGGAVAAELSVEAVVACLESAGIEGETTPPESDRPAPSTAGDGEPASARPATPSEPLGGVVIEAVCRANQAVRARRQEDPDVASMAATLIVAVASAVSAHESTWLVAGIGDSRALLVTPMATTQVTEDDNVAAQLVKSGKLTEAEAQVHPGRHWITRAIGPDEQVEPHTTRVQLFGGDVLVVASDGLDVLAPDDVRAAVGAPGTAREIAERLVAQALQKGAADNVTAVVARHRPQA